MKILDTIYNLPSTIVTGISNVIFGNDDANVDGRSALVASLIKGGILGSIANGFYYAFQGISSVARNHRDAINIAFWASLAVAASVAIAGAVLAAFYPAILATIVGFSVYGISIASLAGASVVAQVAVASGFAAAATQIVSYAGATIVNAASALFALCFGKSSSSTSVTTAPGLLIEQKDNVAFKSGMEALHTTQKQQAANTGAEPKQTGSLFATTKTENNTAADYSAVASLGA